MPYGVKLNREELFMAKKKGLMFLHFIWSKNLKQKSLPVKEGEREGSQFRPPPLPFKGGEYTLITFPRGGGSQKLKKWVEVWCRVRSY